jgi:outer membrane immunogenic protein
MKKILFAAAALAALVAVPALGADRPVPVYKAPPPPAPVFSWTGFYIGVNVGGVWSRWDRTDNIVCPVSVGGCVPDQSAIDNINTQFPTDEFTRFGLGGGGQVGFNYQFGGAVAGVEVDAMAFNFAQTHTFSGNFFTNFPTENQILTSSVKLRGLFTARGRLGFLLIPNLLVYGTGGVAAASVDLAHTFAGFGDNGISGLSATESSSLSKTVWGPAFGLGAEYAFGNWSVKAEYIWTHLSSMGWAGSLRAVDSTGAPIGNVYNHGDTLFLQMARIGLNYHFSAVTDWHLQ